MYAGRAGNVRKRFQLTKPGRISHARDVPLKQVRRGRAKSGTAVALYQPAPPITHVIPIGGTDRMRHRTRVATIVTIIGTLYGSAVVYRVSAQSRVTLSAAFERQVLTPPGEAPFPLRFFTTAVKTNSKGEIITGPTSDPVKNLVGAEPAGERAGMQRFTRIMFGADYFNGRPDPGTRIDPNNPVVNSGKEYWPYIKQPFRSQPNALALTPDGAKLYVALPGREGYPDWRVAVVDTNARRVLRWIDLRPAGYTLGTHPD